MTVSDDCFSLADFSFWSVSLLASLATVIYLNLVRCLIPLQTVLTLSVPPIVWSSSPDATHPHEATSSAVQQWTTKTAQAAHFPSFSSWRKSRYFPVSNDTFFSPSQTPAPVAPPACHLKIPPFDVPKRASRSEARPGMPLGLILCRVEVHA